MFAEEVRLAGRMSWALGVGMKAVSDEYHMTVQNAFVSLNQQAFSHVDGAFGVDWEKITVSAGPVAPVALTDVAVNDDNVLNVRFEPNLMWSNANRYDSIYMWVYCPEIKYGYLASPVYRMDKKMKVKLPDCLRNREIHIYTFAVDKEGLSSMSSYAKPDNEESAQTQPQNLTEANVSDSTNYPNLTSSVNDINPTENNTTPEDSVPANPPDDTGGGGQYEMNFG